MINKKKFIYNFIKILSSLILFINLTSSSFATSLSSKQNLTQIHITKGNDKNIKKNKSVPKYKLTNEIENNKQNQNPTINLKKPFHYSENGLSKGILIFANFLNVIVSSAFLVATAILIYSK